MPANPVRRGARRCRVIASCLFSIYWVDMGQAAFMGTLARQQHGAVQFSLQTRQVRNVRQVFRHANASGVQTHQFYLFAVAAGAQDQTNGRILTLGAFISIQPTQV